MRLFPVTDLREELGFDDMPDINAAIAAALNSATPTLASDLGTPGFDRALSVDTFYVEEPGRRVGNGGATEFRLSNGFISSITSITSSGYGVLGADGLGVLDENGFRRLVTYQDTNAATNLAGRFTQNVADLEKGILKDLSWPYNRETLRIEYEHGFETDADEEGQYDLGTIPSWLAQAAKLRALLTLAGSPAMSQAGIKLETKAMGLEYRGIIEGKRRYAPSALLPL